MKPADPGVESGNNFRSGLVIGSGIFLLLGVQAYFHSRYPEAPYVHIGLASAYLSLSLLCARGFCRLLVSDEPHRLALAERVLSACLNLASIAAFAAGLATLFTGLDSPPTGLLLAIAISLAVPVGTLVAAMKH